MEIAANFANTGKAYLVGVAITDTPASLGTTANYSRAQALAGQQDTTFSQYRPIEESTAMTPTETPQQTDGTQARTQTEQIAEGIFARLLALFKKNEQPQPEAPAEEQPEKPETQPDYRAEYQAAAELIQKLTDKITAVENQYSELLHKLETEPAAPERPAHTGHTPPTVGW